MDIKYSKGNGNALMVSKELSFHSFNKTVCSLGCDGICAKHQGDQGHKDKHSLTLMEGGYLAGGDRWTIVSYVHMGVMQRETL